MPTKTKRRRLEGFDYRTSNLYFVTICSKNKHCIFGDVQLDQMILSRLGTLVQTDLELFEERAPNIELHSSVVMPNHVHLLILLKNEVNDANGRSLSILISRFKFGCTRAWRKIEPKAGEIWQNSFHDVIIRSEKQYEAVVTYIADNPIKWHLDRLNPGWRAQ